MKATDVTEVTKHKIIINSTIQTPGGVATVKAVDVKSNFIIADTPKTKKPYRQVRYKLNYEDTIGVLKEI